MERWIAGSVVSRSLDRWIGGSVDRGIAGSLDRSVNW